MRDREGKGIDKLHGRERYVEKGKHYLEWGWMEECSKARSYGLAIKDNDSFFGDDMPWP